jgi:hypothetical protein
MKLHVLKYHLLSCKVKGLQTPLTAGVSTRRFEFVPRAQNVGFVLDMLDMLYMLDIVALGRDRPKYWERNLYHGHFADHKFHIACP